MESGLNGGLFDSSGGEEKPTWVKTTLTSEKAVWGYRGKAGFYLDYSTNKMYAFYGTHDGSDVTNSVLIVSLDSLTTETITLPAATLNNYHYSCALHNDTIYAFSKRPSGTLLKFNKNTKTSTVINGAVPSTIGGELVYSLTRVPQLVVYNNSIIVDIIMRVKSGTSYTNYYSIIKFNLTTQTFENTFLPICLEGTLQPGMQLEGDNLYTINYKSYTVLELNTLNLKTSTTNTKVVQNTPSRVSQYNSLVTTNNKYPGKLFLHSSRTRSLRYPCEFSLSVIDISSCTQTYWEELPAITAADGTRPFEMNNIPYLWNGYLIAGGGYETSSAVLNSTKIGYIDPKIFK